MRFVLPLAVIAMLGFMLWRGLYSDPSLVRSPLIGKPLPAFSLPSLAGDQLLSNQQFIGKKRLLNVWASWCAACQLEHDVLLGLQASGVEIIGLNYKDKQLDAIDWLEERGNPYSQIIFDADGKFGIELGVYGVPETFLIDEQGIIQYKHVGPVSVETVRNELVPLFTGKQAQSL